MPKKRNRAWETSLLMRSSSTAKCPADGARRRSIAGSPRRLPAWRSRCCSRSRVSLNPKPGPSCKRTTFPRWPSHLKWPISSPRRAACFQKPRPRAPARSKRVLQSPGKFLQRIFVALVPPPLSHLASLHQPGTFEDCHMVRDGWLREFDTQLDVAGAESHILADRTGSTLLESLENPAAVRVGDRLQNAIQRLVRRSHNNEQ